MRARIDALEAELRSLRLSEDETPPPHLPPPSPTSIPPMRDLHREEPLPLIEPEEVFEPYPDPGADLRARIRELSNVIETAFPPPSKGAQR